MRELLAWMEASMLGELVRGSGVWTYAILNLGHILGISTLFGSVAVLDLRLLSVTRRVPIASVARVTVPLAKAGFVLAVVTGVPMICTNATEYVGNPFLLIKFPAIVLGLLNVGIISRLPAWRATRERELHPHESRQLALMGGLSLASWLTRSSRSGWSRWALIVSPMCSNADEMSASSCLSAEVRSRRLVRTKASPR